MSSCEAELATLYRGDSRVITVNVTNSIGTPIDITGMTLTLTLAKQRQGTPVCTIVNTTHDNAVGGVSKFLITETQTESTAPGLHHIDIVLTSPPSTISTVFIGTIRIENRVALP